MSVTLRGASDDLIEIDGDVNEEFNPQYGNDVTYIGFSTGTLVSIQYTEDGVWRIAPVFVNGAEYSNVQCSGDSDADIYSDVATIAGDVKWAVQGPQMKLYK